MWWVLLIWFLFCVGVGIRIYYENDHKFGTHNFQIAVIGALVFFFLPIIMPVAWVHELVRDK